MQEKTVTAKEAAVRLGLSKETVVRWCRAGTMPGAYVLYGRRQLGWRIPESTITKLLERPYASSS